MPAGPAIENRTPYAHAPLFLADEAGKPSLVVVVKATVAIGPNGRLTLADRQRDVSLAGEPWGEADTSSYRYEPETAFVKPSTDVVLVGHARCPRGVGRETEVEFRVGPVGKRVRVTGDRVWTKRIGGKIVPSDPVAFETMPLAYERAFGGHDASTGTPPEVAFEPRNPVGRGYRAPRGRFDDGVALPNLEDPARPLDRYGDLRPPCGVGFVSPSWEPRSKLAGTYDDAWLRDRMPMLPADFDPRFFNAASEGLVTPGHLRGDEPVVVRNAGPLPELRFSLPGLRPPAFSVERRGHRPESHTTQLDTVIVDTDAAAVVLLWRGRVGLRWGPHDLAAVVIGGRD